MPRLLGPNETHLWTAALDGRDTSIALLDSEERKRADRFNRPHPRADFIRTRTILRRLLAGYLERDPAGLVFTLGPHGKPTLLGTGLQFNASHSGNCLTIAVRWHVAVGVDVEGQRDVANVLAIARRFFAPAEANQIEALPAARQPDAFRALWTLKEAIVKAAGEALAYHLDRIEGALEADGLARFVAWHGMDEAWQNWSVFSFCPSAGFTATLATKSPSQPPRLLPWDDTDF